MQVAIDIIDDIKSEMDVLSPKSWAGDVFSPKSWAAEEEAVEVDPGQIKPIDLSQAIEEAGKTSAARNGDPSLVTKVGQEQLKNHAISTGSGCSFIKETAQHFCASFQLDGLHATSLKPPEQPRKNKKIR